MKIHKFYFSGVCLKKVLRTFLQTVIGYVFANVTLYFGGIDFADGDILRNALIGLAIAAFSAGSAAVMNIEKVSSDDDKDNISEEIDKGEDTANG